MCSTLSSNSIWTRRRFKRYFAKYSALNTRRICYLVNLVDPIATHLLSLSLSVCIRLCVCATMPIHHRRAHMCSQFALLIDISTAPLAHVSVCVCVLYILCRRQRRRPSTTFQAIQYEHERCIRARTHWLACRLCSQNSAPFVRSQRFYNEERARDKG